MWPEQKKDINYLTNLPGASEKLHIINADLDRPDSFEAAIDGCIGVFHVAHPVDFKGVESEEAITRRAVEGTLGILKACLKSKSVKRVVYTSSAATVMFNNKDQGVTDESIWSDNDFCKPLKLMATSYMVSKTKTERAALEFAEKHGLDLVTLIPSLVVGPFICPDLPGSVYMGMAMILGMQLISQIVTFHA